MYPVLAGRFLTTGPPGTPDRAARDQFSLRGSLCTLCQEQRLLLKHTDTFPKLGEARVSILLGHFSGFSKRQGLFFESRRLCCAGFKRSQERQLFTDSSLTLRGLDAGDQLAGSVSCLQSHLAKKARCPGHWAVPESLLGSVPVAEER